MAAHVHYDLDAAEKNIRAAMARTAAEAMASAVTEDSRLLIAEQAALEDATVALARWDMARLSEGRDDERAAQALGFILGNFIFSFAGNTEYEPTDMVGVVMNAAAAAINGAFEGGHPDAVNHATHIDPAPSGRA